MKPEFYIDIETRSGVNLKKSNVYRYVTDPDFQILMLAYAHGNSVISVLTDPDDIDGMVRYLVNVAQPAGTLLVAHNANFERVCFSQQLGLDVAHGECLDPDGWDDTAQLAREHGYPASLGDVAKALGVTAKDTAGTHLINWFCKPLPDGTFRKPEDHPEKWDQFKTYCGIDVEVLREVRDSLPGWPTETERQAWLVDQRVNDRGIKVDVDMAEAAVDTAASNAEVQMAEVRKITGVDNPNSNVQLLGWLTEAGADMDNLRKETVEATLEQDDLDPKVRRVLELRQELALVASKKYSAMLDRVTADHRLKGAFQFFGAHTGRWAGRGVQLQNLPSDTIQPAEGQHVDEAIAVAADLLTLGLGADAKTLKALVRAAFLGPFTVVDYSAIEARVVSWLAGEQWALDAFAAGRDIYVETAERMGGLTRKEGKVAVLALGYNGGTGSLEAMGATGTKKYLQGLVTQWRTANPNIVQLWGELDEAFRRGGPVGEHLSVEKDGHDRLIRLPSGRAITYHRVGQKWVTKTWPSGDTSRVRQIIFADPANPGRRVDTYGGRLTENVTQAVARDILTQALIDLDLAGYAVVGHVHDEVLVEGSDLEGVTAIMTTPPDWAGGLPINAEGFITPRYRKD